jgi:ADP-ribose pyrophosphatase YjhB (NUDIX family)
MPREPRISAGAIVIHRNRILLVRTQDEPGKTYLVAPGGGVEDGEGINQAVVREVREETGLEVAPRRILFVEDLFWSRYRILKIWFLCDLVRGQIAGTGEAAAEGILEAGWYSRQQLQNESVYPVPILAHDWNAFFRDTWEAIYLDRRWQEIKGR